MLLQILDVIAPVFLVIGSGYLSVKRDWFKLEWIDGLMKFAILFAVPCLLFRATASLDLGAAFDGRMMLAYYLAAGASFTLTAVLANSVFARPAGDSVAIGFGALFSNLVLMGLAISQRAWGADNMATAYAIVSVHAPFCYLLGITTMEIVSSNGRPWRDTVVVIVKAMFRNSLMIGIGLGFIVNLSGLAVPGVIDATAEILSRAALPAALFAIGGVLTRYHLSQSVGEVGLVSGFSLLLHPAMVLGLCSLMDVPREVTAAAVLMAAMPSGVNVYLFASMYNRAMDVAAGTVVFATVASVLSISGWLYVLNA